MSHRGSDLLDKNLMEEKRKKRKEEVILIEDSTMIVDPSSPIERHVKLKLTRRKLYRQMTSKVTQEFFDKIMSSYQSHVFFLYNNNRI